jgi:hypothetical protein
LQEERSASADLGVVPGGAQRLRPAPLNVRIDKEEGKVMGHKLKKLGVSLVAVLALSLAITSIAAAALFTSSSYPASYKGEGNPEEYGYVTVEAGTVKCKSGSASATLSSASSTLSISGQAGGCSAFGFVEAKVVENGCTTLVHVKEGSGDTYTGTGDLVCPEGKSVVTTASTCEMQVPSQTGSVTLEFTNNTPEGSVSVKVKTSHFKYNVTKDGFLCPFGGTGAKTDGTGTQIKTAVVKIEGKTLSVS